MKFSAKLLTALAAVALLVVALSGGPRSAHAAATGTVAFDKAFYTVSGVSGAPASVTAKVTITDADQDVKTQVTAEAHTAVFSDSNASLQLKLTNGNIVDSTGEGSVDSSDITLDSTSAATYFVTLINKVQGVVQLTTKDFASASTTVAATFTYKHGQIDTVSVVVKSTQDTGGIAVTATETGISTGVFTVTVKLVNTSSSTSTTPAELKTLDKDTLTAVYTDPEGSTGGEVSVSATAKMETSGPTISNLIPTTKTATQDRKPTFSAQIEDSEAGVDLNKIILRVDADADGTLEDIASEKIALTGTDVVVDSASGVVTVSHTLTADIPNSIGTASPEHDIKWQIEATDLALNTSKSDSDTTTSAEDPHIIRIDGLAPGFASGQSKTGPWWDTSITATDKTQTDTTKAKRDAILLVFDEDLNLDSVDSNGSDFAISGGFAISRADVFTGNKKQVFLTLTSDLAPSDKPAITVIGQVADVAGNTRVAGSVTVADGIPPKLTLTIKDAVTVTKDKVTAIISSDESLLGNAPTVVAVYDSDSAVTAQKSGINAIVKGTNLWEADILATGLDAGAATGNKQSIYLEGKDAAGNTATVGKKDVTSSSAITYTLDTSIDAPTVLPTGTTNTDINPLVQISFSEKVTVTLATFDGTDVLSALAASTDGKKWVLSRSGLSLAVHTVKVTATDVAANTLAETTFTFTIIAKKDFELPLLPGWNLVSLPGEPGDSSINSVITDAEVSQVLTYDNGVFMTAVRDSATGLLAGDLTTIDSRHAYWINTTSFNPIKVSIEPLAGGSLPPTIPVTTGWNLVPVNDTTGVIAAGADLSENVGQYLSGVKATRVYKYDTLTAQYKTLKTATSGTTSVATVGDGWWVWVTEDGTITP